MLEGWSSSSSLQGPQAQQHFAGRQHDFLSSKFLCSDTERELNIQPTVCDEHVLQSSMSHCSGLRVHLSNPHTENAILTFYVQASGGGGIEIYLGSDEVGRRGAHRGISVALCKSRKRSHTLALSIHAALTTYQHRILGLSAFITVSQMCAYSSPGIHHRDLHTSGPR